MWIEFCNSHGIKQASAQPCSTVGVEEPRAVEEADEVGGLLGMHRGASLQFAPQGAQRPQTT
jgi:hypothetical protein